RHIYPSPIKGAEGALGNFHFCRGVHWLRRIRRAAIARSRGVVDRVLCNEQRLPLGPRIGNVICGVKGIVVGEGAAFADLPMKTDGDDRRARKSAVPVMRPNHGRQAASAFGARPAIQDDAVGCCDMVEGPSLRVVDIDDLPNAVVRKRRPEAACAFPEITCPVRLFFAAVLFAAVESSAKKECDDMCLATALRNLGRKALQRVQMPRRDSGPAKCVARVFFHFVAVEVLEDGCDVIDGDQRCQFDGTIRLLQ
ncbi:unnamed protein product, partial [Prorocentrum cordatum]